MPKALLRKFENNQVFNENEAWTLFRLAALAEAFGWSLLIIGIAIERFVFPGNHLAVLIAGRIHGLLFSLYALSSVGLYPALGWSRKKSLLALAASVPPYGSLLFERSAAYVRQNSQFKSYGQCVLLARLTNNS
jgi:integral membrane protein